MQSYPLAYRVVGILENILLYLIVGFLIGRTVTHLPVGSQAAFVAFLGLGSLFAFFVELLLIRRYPAKMLGWDILNENPKLFYFIVYHAIAYLIVGSSLTFIPRIIGW